MATTPEAPVQSDVKVTKAPPETQNAVEETPEKEVSKTADKNGVGLLSNPQETLDYFREVARKASESMPAQFGSFLLNASSEMANLTVRPGARPLGEQQVPTDFSKQPTLDLQALPFEKKENTRIHGTGSKVDTKVEIRYDKDGKANFVRDHIGEWQSVDGGKTWKTGQPNFRVRRGDVSIDAKGDYNFENTDYGVKNKFTKEGTSTRSITTGDGDQYSLTRDKKGTPISFTDKEGEWKSTGNTWTNLKSGEKKAGTVQLSEFGEFKFKPDKGETQIARTAQLDRINQLQDEICKESGVIFAKPGERKKNVMPEEQTSDGSMRPGEKPPEEKLINGVPTVQELETLKDVMTNTSHENYRGVKVWFIRPDENATPMLAKYENDGKGKPTPEHACAGDCCSKRGISRSANGDMVILPLSRVETKGILGLEGTLYHELGHHEQYMKFKSLEFVGPYASKQSNDLAKEMGWIAGKEQPLFKDKTGGLWSHNEEDGTFRFDSGTLPKDGKRTLDQLQMRERALVRPITTYFDNAIEMHAEALSMYRMGERADIRGGRQYLATDSPKLYETIKKFDQAAIDKKMGQDEQGHSKFIRGIDGKLVENTSAIRQLIEQREAEWRARGSVDPTPVRTHKRHK